MIVFHVFLVYVFAGQGHGFVVAFFAPLVDIGPHISNRLFIAPVGMPSLEWRVLFIYLYFLAVSYAVFE